jgi:hypothetical protein
MAAPTTHEFDAGRAVTQAKRPSSAPRRISVTSLTIPTYGEINDSRRASAVGTADLRKPR